MTFSALDRHLVRRVFTQLAIDVEDSINLFYQRLSELAPDLLMTYYFERGQHLMRMLALAVKFIDQPIALAAWADIMRQQHTIRDEDFQQVGDSLLWVIQKRFGDAFTWEMEQAWTQFYDYLSRLVQGLA
jgi:hemoglobin-like flavoprotein